MSSIRLDPANPYQMTLLRSLSRQFPTPDAALAEIARLSAILTLLGILVSDILYALVDPRVSFEGRR